MIVSLRNIQGFRGEFSYTIDQGLNVITSMFNGTGKTTFYECLKFLHNPSLFDKTERRFLLNKYEKKGMFMISDSDYSFGFILEGEDFSLISKTKGEEVFTYSKAPHPYISTFTQVFFTDKTFINICDRFLNLFSSSNTSYNHDLVNSFLTHRSLEKANELTTLELDTAKREYNSNKDNLAHYSDLIKSAMYYKHLKEFEVSLDCEELILYSESLELLSFNFSKCNELNPLISGKVLERIFAIAESLFQLSTIHPNIDGTYLLDVVDLYLYFCELKEVQSEITLNGFDIILELYSYSSEVLQQAGSIDTNDIALTANLCEIISDVAELRPLSDDSYILSLVNFFELIKKVDTNKKRIDFFKKKEASARAELLNFEHQCEIKGTVYIVGGECLQCVNRI